MYGKVFNHRIKLQKPCRLSGSSVLYVKKVLFAFVINVLFALLVHLILPFRVQFSANSPLILSVEVEL